ncbi:MAG: hypothetical protein H5U05_01210 [Candidatus Aminicenantes bacterium]|nr:hypothetical protein [Candidatus Aminicenantes bacterium]
MLAENDGYGECLREYLYIGAKMVAEYQPQTGKYYYYTTDQIGSTRIVTDDTGNIVYAAAHDPYGGVKEQDAILTGQCQSKVLYNLSFD